MVEEALSHVAVPAQAPAGRSTDYFGELVFGRNVMRRYLDRETYEALIQTMEHGTPLTREVADGIAAGMKQWAVEHGADHYTALVPAAHGRNRRETRRLRRTRRTGRRARRVLRQAARPAGTRCLVVPRTAASATRSKRAATPPGTPRRPPSSSARRSASRPCSSPIPARRSTTRPRCCARWQAVDRAATEVCRYFDRNVTKVIQLPGLGAGVLPRGRSAVGRTPRPGADGPYAHGPRIGQEPAARRPLFRRDSRTA